MRVEKVYLRIGAAEGWLCDVEVPEHATFADVREALPGAVLAAAPSAAAIDFDDPEG